MKRLRRQSEPTSHAKRAEEWAEKSGFTKSLAAMRAKYRKDLTTRVPKLPWPTEVNATGTGYRTTSALGTVHGWDTCGRCGYHVFICRCATPLPSRGVEYCLDQDDARSRGESWGPNHEHYKGSFLPVKARGALKFAGVVDEVAHPIAAPVKPYRKLRRTS